MEPKKPMQGPFDFGSGFLYVTDYFNHRVVRMNDITRKRVGLLWGRKVVGLCSSIFPLGSILAWDHPSIPPKRRFSWRIARTAVSSV